MAATRDVKNAQKRFEAELGGNPAVRGVGIVDAKNGETGAALAVYVNDRTDHSVSAIPHRYDFRIGAREVSVPIHIIEIGVVRAQPVEVAAAV